MKPEKLNFVRLGSRYSTFRKLSIGNKAALLNHAVKSDLPVPNGVLLPSGAWERMIDDGLISLRGRDVIIEAADEVVERFALNGLRKDVAVRSAFSAEDRPDQALAGFFKTILHVDHTDRDAILRALVEVWQSGNLREGDFRRDMLVMEMVDAQVAGVAFTQRDFQDDLVNFTEGTGDKLVSGEVAGGSLLMPKLQGYEQPTFVENGWQRRLQSLLRGVRRSFNLKGTEWDIEWADDGKKCWLLQIRPITAAPRRNEAFTYANLREILPDPPSPYMTAIVADASQEFFAWYRQFDKTLPESRPMVEVFHGRPLFNISLLTDMMRHWGLPTGLVTNSIGGEADVESGLRFGRFVNKSLVLLRLGWNQINAVRHAKEKETVILQMAQNADDSFAGLTKTFQELFVLFVTEMFNLTQAMSGPLLILRRTDLLEAHSAGNETETTRMFGAFRELRAAAARSPENRAALASGTMPADALFATAWQDFLDQFGHRGVYESDIARPRYRENQAELLRGLAVGGSEPLSGVRKQSGELLFQVTKPMWWQLRRVQDAREAWRSQAMRCYEIVRGRLLVLAERAVANGQLPGVDDLWLLRSDEVAKLDRGGVFEAAFFERRSAEIAANRQIDLPDLVHRFDDLTASDNDEISGDSLRGVSLTAGGATGRAWVLHEPQTVLPDDYNPDTTILVARSVDAGWIPTFGLVAGVVVEIGGDLSHGSIILREIGLPAITNVRGATRAFAEGEQLDLDAGRGVVRRQVAVP